MPDSMKVKYERLFKVWTAFKNTLEDAEIMLKKKQNELMDSLSEKQFELRTKAKELLQMFLETAPISTEWKSNGKCEARICDDCQFFNFERSKRRRPPTYIKKKILMFLVFYR